MRGAFFIFILHHTTDPENVTGSHREPTGGILSLEGTIIPPRYKNAHRAQKWTKWAGYPNR